MMLVTLAAHYLYPKNQPTWENVSDSFFFFLPCQPPLVTSHTPKELPRIPVYAEMTGLKRPGLIVGSVRLLCRRLCQDVNKCVTTPPQACVCEPLS